MTQLTPEQWARYQALWDRHTEAQTAYPDGTWKQRWLPRVCKHERTRCVHGDEINARGSRVACLTCGRSLRRLPLPVLCWFTGARHSGTYPEEISHG